MTGFLCKNIIPLLHCEWVYFGHRGWETVLVDGINTSRRDGFSGIVNALCIVFCGISIACAPTDEVTRDNHTCGSAEKPCATAANTGSSGRGAPTAEQPQDRGLDSDGDGVNDHLDNCPSVVNPRQWDRDQDGLGDRCDLRPNTKTFTVAEQSLAGQKQMSPRHGVIVQSSASNGVYTLNSTVTQ